MIKIISLFLLIIFPSLSQNQQKVNLLSVKVGSFSIDIENSTLNVFNVNSENVFKKKFDNPANLISDLDEDGIDEYIIIDSSFTDNHSKFTIYIFNTVDSFFLVDSIYSGATHPYIEFSEELAGTIIITGVPEFDDFNYISNEKDHFFSPINCWNYENEQIFLVNEQLYDIFINENEEILGIIEEHSQIKEKDCNSSLEILGAITAVYANYINAGEKSVASQFLNKYYLCEDAEELKQKMNNLTEGNFNEDGLE